ncbi:MAG: NADH:flavin oxidoreductase, partial [Pseudomonadota bacterium]
KDVIARFANTSKIAQETGFDGVQLHAAHGYLISQFLSPKSNRREDEWGGSLENRARLLVESVRAIRAVTGPSFPISVKLNSADFQSGGFTHEDCLGVVDMLNAEGVDLLEITGGNYEQPKMANVEGLEPVFEEEVRESTRAREAYFIGYAKSARERANMPIMATGGFRTLGAMEAAIQDGEADMIGMARPLCVEPDLPNRLLSGDVSIAPDWENRLSLGPTKWLGKNSPINLIKTLNGWGVQGWFNLQLIRMSEGQAPDTGIGVFKAFTTYQKLTTEAAKAYKADLETA